MESGVHHLDSQMTELSSQLASNLAAGERTPCSLLPLSLTCSHAAVQEVDMFVDSLAECNLMDDSQGPGVRAALPPQLHCDWRRAQSCPLTLRCRSLRKSDLTSKTGKCVAVLFLFFSFEQWKRQMHVARSQTTLVSFTATRIT